MFVDIAKINIKAGNGGNGAVAFHREKYVAAGGPDGGDGGRGGNIVFQADDSLATLSDFRYKRKYKAPSGEDGRGARQNGKKGPYNTCSARHGNTRSNKRNDYGGYVNRRAVYSGEGR